MDGLKQQKSTFKKLCCKNSKINDSGIKVLSVAFAALLFSSFDSQKLLPFFAPGEGSAIGA